MSIRKRTIGYLLFEALVCLAVMGVILGSLGTTVAIVRRSLALAEIRERQTEAWMQLSQTLRDDLRSARQVRWSAPAAHVGGAIEIGRTDGSTVTYQSGKRIVASAANSGKGAPLIRNFNVEVELTALRAANGLSKEIWKLSAMENGTTISIGGQASFFLAEATVKYAGAAPRSVVVGAATRCETDVVGAK